MSKQAPFFFFTLCFFLPVFVFALHEKDCRALNDHARQERSGYERLQSESDRLGHHERKKKIELLKEARECCRRAVADWDKILNDIANQPRHKREKEWRVKLKSSCSKNKRELEEKIPCIEAEVHRIEGTLAFDEAFPLHQQAIQKATEAATKNQSFERDIFRSDEVIASLNSIVQLYEEAITLAYDALSHLFTYYSQIENREIWRSDWRTYLALQRQAKEEIANWSTFVQEQKTALQKKLQTFKADSELLAAKGLKRASYDLQKLALPLLETLLKISSAEEKLTLEKELTELKEAISAFEVEADAARLIHSPPSLSQEEFVSQERERKKSFFKSEFFLNPNLFLLNLPIGAALPRVIPIDGQMIIEGGAFSLYTDQFYRFLIESSFEIPEISIAVFEAEKELHVETIALPFANPQGLETYLKEGMLFSPETCLKSQYGLDLRLSFFYSPKKQFSLIVSQKIADPRYRISLSLKKGSPALYKCDFLLPPPWQLGVLRKPSLIHPDKKMDPSNILPVVVPQKEVPPPLSFLETKNFQALDRLVEDLKKDPLALAGYVQNEIALIDPFSLREGDVFQAAGIHKSPELTYLQKEGTAWELCHLLIYLLQKAGYDAVYALADFCTLPKDLAEKMLFTTLATNDNQAKLKYPAVLLFDGNEWVSLFPWVKEMQIREEYDLYHSLPEDFATPHRWMLRYLKSDEAILKYAGSDEDDTPAFLFVRSVEDELRKKGLSLSDVGIERISIKKQFSSWSDFPRPSVHGTVQIYRSLAAVDHVFALARLSIQSRNNPQKIIEPVFHLATLTSDPSVIRFVNTENGGSELQLQIAGEIHPLMLDSSDSLINISIHYEHVVGSLVATHTFSIAKGTLAALCLHLGGVGSKYISQCYERFSLEENEDRRLEALLAFVGASYFEKCSRAEKVLADLHKVRPGTAFAFGLSKLSPAPSKKCTSMREDLALPQVDTMWFRGAVSNAAPSCVWHQEPYSARSQLDLLCALNNSANEHQILSDVFGDSYAVSTVKLLRLAHLEHLKKGGEGEGFLKFNSNSFAAADKNADFKNVKNESREQWQIVKTLLHPLGEQSRWCFAFMTPGLISSQNDSYKEAATFIYSPVTQYALISSNNLVLNGGLGSALPRDFLTPSAIKQWELLPKENGYSLQMASLESFPPLPAIESFSQISDVRPPHKSFLSCVADPVDVVTGAFYIDETDLILPGPFALAIRRNYSSQNPSMGDLGCGWKLSLNPFLIEEDGKRFASELDGTNIAYRYNPETSRWEVSPEDNPELCIQPGGINPYQAYIENDILYSADGSRRFFEEGLLSRWVDARGNQLNFFYKDQKLSRIESSNGDFCGFYYNHEGLIYEIYAKDGRRITYEYDPKRDLIKVTLPNTGVIRYEYDRSHRILREIKPHGCILENFYDDQGRVIQQKSPTLPQQQMAVTATFDYVDGCTTVTDAADGKTVYKIFEKQIYKIIDPLGSTILQSWYIDETSWFDPETEQLQPWNGPGSAAKSLKSTTDKRGLTTHYFYDKHGNPEKIELQGKDLTGDGQTSLVKRFAYNDRNLCIEEEISGKKTLFTYDETFPYLPRRIETYSGSVQTSYLELAYNASGLVEKEDHSGAITLWEYNSRGLPWQKTQLTGTEDPDLVTRYAYNLQGQCIEISASDALQENGYDLMGNLTQAKIFSPTKTLLSATYLGYDLNNRPIWEQTANEKNITYFDYDPSGRLIAQRKQLSPSDSFAYTLYEYNPRGDLIEETDPMGYTTYRKYNEMAQLIEETKEGHTTRFTYEPGGLLASVTSPSGSITKRSYITNGLLKEEIYPDGTKNTIVYDPFGRPILETKNDLSWEITYDDANRRVTRTQKNNKEVSEFDARGNLIRFTDAAGYTSEKTYDALNRIKTETTPSGQKTSWSYRGDLVISTLANGETISQRFEGGKVVHSEVHSAEGIFLSESRSHYDPEKDIETVQQGSIVTITQKDALGQPIQIQTGETITSYVYDFQGNCVASTDGDGRTTRQRFDALERLIYKELPDGGEIECFYDLDSNLTEYKLPSGAVWKASYDEMGRKISEELQSEQQSSLSWEYIYKNGYLREAKDPLQRIHSYQYNSNGKLIEETVESAIRTYAYDERGFLIQATQKREFDVPYLDGWICIPATEDSTVDRTYDSDGRLDSESIYLNSRLIQQTRQTWGPSNRVLEIGNHKREYIYQNRQLTQISSGNTNLSYGYDLGGLLRTKSSSASQTAIHYNLTGLPETLRSKLPGNMHEETLSWYPSGKLLEYASSKTAKQFAYTKRGQLQLANQEAYEFDFGYPGTGIRTAAPGSMVPENGLDAFSNVTLEKIGNQFLETAYDPMGQVASQGDKQFTWDPWGRLIKITSETFIWEASYDAFGRRLETQYTPAGGSTQITTSLYDPEEEFREIGIKQGDQIFWKLYGPKSCDAVLDESGNIAYLIHNALGELETVISSQGTLSVNVTISPYGPQSDPSIPTDLLSYAQSLCWHSRSQDPTGLISMGARYYNPKQGRFLSPDPVSYPLCLDLYAYADGDPVNYLDLDGRFSSAVYKAVRPDPIFTPAAQYCINEAVAWANSKGLRRSHSFKVDGSSILGLGFGWINGIQNSYFDSLCSAHYLSQLGGGVKISGVYNAMTPRSTAVGVYAGLIGMFGASVVGDVLKCALTNLKINFPPARLLKSQWIDFFLQNGPDAVFVQYCHSGGAGQVKAALLETPEYIRNKIVVVAIAPSAIIPKKLCLKSYNYMSRRDFVTRTDIEGMINHRDELIVLDPHPKASLLDHEFLSPTFAPVIKRHLDDSIAQFGKRK